MSVHKQVFRSLTAPAAPSSNLKTIFFSSVLYNISINYQKIKENIVKNIGCLMRLRKIHLIFYSNVIFQAYMNPGLDF